MSDVRGHDEAAWHRYRVARGDGRAYPPVPVGDHVDDLAAGYALDALDSADCEAVDRHVHACPRCAGLVAGQRRAVGLLAYAALPARPDPVAKVELFTRIAHAERAATRERSQSWISQPGLPPALTIPASRPVAAAAATGRPFADRGAERRPVRRGWTSWAGAVLTVPLLVALAATGTWAMQLRGEVDERGDRMTALEAFLDGAAGGPIYRLYPRPAAPEAKGWIATDTDQGSVTFYMKDDKARSGQTYELLGKADGTWVRLAEIELDGRGIGGKTFTPDPPLTEYRSLQVTIKAPAVGDVEGSKGDRVALTGNIDGTATTGSPQQEQAQPDPGDNQQP